MILWKIIILLTCFGLNNSSDRRKILYHAVTPIKGLEKLYLNTKPPLENWKVWLPENAKDETKNMRKEVCSTIVTSEHFLDAYKVYPMNVSKSNKRSNVCPAEESHTTISSTEASTYSYKEREVWIGERIVSEQVFPCLACSYETGKIVEFFISQVYQDQARFVFECNDKKKIVPAALADISPTIWQISEWFTPKSGLPTSELAPWLEAKPMFESVVLKYVDTSSQICDKSAAEKVRLCAIILNNDHYRNEHKVRFSPSRNKDPKCTERVIKFHDAYKHVWAISCVVSRAFDTATETYYLSDTTNNHRYMISKEGVPEYLDQVVSSWSF